MAMWNLINGNLRCMSVSLTRIPPLEVRSLNRSCTFVRLVGRFFLFYFLRDASPPCILRKRREQVAFLSGWSGLLPEIERSNKNVTISQNICILTSSAELTLRMGRIGPKSSSWQNCQIFKQFVVMLCGGTLATCISGSSQVTPVTIVGSMNLGWERQIWRLLRGRE